ncbi:fibulin-5-like [Nematostella vectensis]|uniref:fibulin-5-like n=1 Tax=Nematostella vectensis TaxID=45351 RepID=UPI00207798D0|nr:fibulin-5-like [Nematostella vectensis]
MWKRSLGCLTTALPVYVHNIFPLDINECNGNHSCEYKCQNTYGSYKCLCPAGKEVVDGFKCKDVDECASGHHYCYWKSSTCVNTEPGYYCKCKPGYYPAPPPHNGNLTCFGKLGPKTAI